MDLSSGGPDHHNKDLGDSKCKEGRLFLYLSALTGAINSPPPQAHVITEGVKGSSQES